MYQEDIVTLEPGLFAIRTALGKRGLSVYSYLIVDHGEAILIDAGLPETTGQIVSLLETLRATPRLLALTHAHGDHIGAAGALQATGCPVAIQRQGAALLLDENLRYRDFVGAFPTQLPISPSRRQDWFRSAGPPLSPDFVFTGEEFSFQAGRLKIQAIPAGGHSWDSVCYFVPETGWMFTGDAVGSDGMGALPPCYRDTDLYVDSMQSLLKLPPRRLLAGHFPALEPEAARRILHLSLETVDALQETVSETLQHLGRPGTLGEICRESMRRFGREYSHQALFTTQAHLDRLERQGLVRKYGVEDALYVPAAPDLLAERG